MFEEEKQEKPKKLYWLKLKRDFFKRHDIKVIEGMENGKDYLLFYLKLLVESLDHEGELRFSETIPYNEKMLSSVTNTNIDIVRSAMKLLSELGFVEILDDETIYMTEVHKMVGSETEWAKKKREYRLSKKEECKQIQDTSRTKKDNVRQEYRDKSIDNINIPKGILSIPYTEIIDYLNKKTGKNFRSSTPKTQKLIKARWNEGYRLEDFFQVIDTKCSQWLKDTKMNKYLQPETLFGTKFEGYLNENVKKSSGYGSLEGFAPTVTDTDIGDFD